MTPVILELSDLEVEPIEVATDAPMPEQDRSLETLITPQEKIGIRAVLTVNGSLARSCCYNGTCTNTCYGGCSPNTCHNCEPS